MPELDAATDLSTIEDHAAAATALLRLLANERRLMVLCMLIGVGEASVGTLSAHARLSPAAMSQHLAKLRHDGVVATRRSGTTIYYRIADRRIEAIIATLRDIFCLRPI